MVPAWSDAPRAPRAHGIDRGFTLVELVVAIVLVGMLSAIAVIGVGRLTSEGEAAACGASLGASRAAVTTHLAMTGVYPTTFAEMEASGSLSLPDGAEVDPGGLVVSAAAWNLRMAPGAPPTFMCGGDLPVAGAVAHFDAAETASIETANLCSTVTRWADRSGNGNHLDSPGPAPAPGIGWSATAQGGRPAVTTSGASVLRNPSLSLGSSSVFVVARITGAPSQRILSGWNNNWLLGWWMGRQDLAFFEGWLPSASSTAGTSTTLYSAMAQPGIRSTVWRNGTQIATSTTATASPNGLAMGGAFVQVAEFSASAVSEVIVYDRPLTDVERQQTERYLGAKWGLTIAGIEPPAMAPGPVAWFDATSSSDLASTTTCVADSVTGWRSVTGTRTLVPRLGEPAAVRDPVGFGGLPAVVTNGINNLVDTGLSLPGDATVAVVAQPIGPSARILSSTGNNWLLGWWGGRERVAHFDAWLTNASAAPTAAGPHLYTAVIDRGVLAEVFGDGVLIATSNAATTTPVGLSIGGAWGTSEFTRAAVAEVVVFDRVLAADERRMLEDYLAAKWGLTLP